MHGVLFLLLLSSAELTPAWGFISPEQRCAIVATERPRQWLMLARQELLDRPRGTELVQLTRRRGWVPSVALKTGFRSDDDQRASLAESGDLSNYRTSVISRGGRQFSAELALKWDLGILFSSPLELGVRRHHAQQQQAFKREVTALIKSWQKWLSLLAQICVDTTQKKPDLNTQLIGVEATLDHLSDGRFSRWLRENMQ